MRVFLAVCLVASPVLAGSNSLLDVSPDGKTLLVANPDVGTVALIDLASRKRLAELPAGDHPEGVAWAGGVALATVYGDDRLLFIDPVAMKVAHVLDVADEPYGVVATADGKRAYVSHDYPGTVSEIDVPGRKVLRTFTVGSGCRGLALSADGHMLYVTEFHTGNLLAVDIAAGKVTDRWTGRSTDNLSRHVSLHPTRPKAYLAHIRSMVTAFSATASIAPVLSVCDLNAGESRRRIVPLDAFNGNTVIATPWETACAPDGKTLYAIYAGTNDANVCDLIDDDFREASPRGRTVKLGKNPRAVRVSPDGREVYVYHAVDADVTIFDAGMRKELAHVQAGTPAHTAEWRRGKELFNLAAPPMTNERWVACASCHPDGLSDGRVWANPDGPRKTPHLFGLAHTHPLHYSADRDEVQDFEYTIRGKLMLGRGLYRGPLKPSELDEPLAGKSPDLDALAVYTNSYTMRISPHPLDDAARRGQALFAGAQCATCHSGPYFTDSSLTKPYKLHDVGTGGGPNEKLGPAYDTPSLLWAYRTGPYLHDGRAKTLRDVLTQNPGDRHGTTSHLTSPQLDDLVSFLKALPFEKPPEDTPNAVKHRLTLTYRRP